MNSYAKGIHRLSTAFTVNDVAIDPTTVTFTLKGGNVSESYVYGTDDELVKDSTGVYHVDYDFDESGYYLYSFIGTGTCDAVDSDYVIIGSTADLIVATSLELEDTTNTIFSTTTVNRGIEAALVTASQYVPYEDKVTVDMVADSKDIDISSINGLIKVLYAEYKVSQTPRTFRNVTKFGNTITVNTELNPASGDDCYLYCHLVHTPDTLDLRLSNSIIPKLAASYCAMNNVGDGRTQIKSAIDAAALVNSSTDSMTARLAQSVTDIASVRTQVTSLLSSADTAITNAGTYITTALATIGSAKSSSAITTTTELTAAGTALGKAITDIDLTRALLATNATTISTEIGKVDTEIGLAITDLASARALNNTITISGNAEAQKHSSALGELSTAQALLQEARGLAQDGSTLDSNSTISGNDLQIAAGYLSKARTIISEALAEAGQFNHSGSVELSAANTAINQARTIISKIANAAQLYGVAASKEIQAASSYLSQAGGYAREVSSRLSVANVISSYQRWGQNLYAQTIRELRALKKPEVVHTYSDY